MSAPDVIAAVWLASFLSSRSSPSRARSRTRQHLVRFRVALNPRFESFYFYDFFSPAIAQQKYIIVAINTVTDCHQSSCGRRAIVTAAAAAAPVASARGPIRRSCPARAATPAAWRFSCHSWTWWSGRSARWRTRVAARPATRDFRPARCTRKSWTSWWSAAAWPAPWSRPA